MVASQNGHVRVVQILLSAGADVNAKINNVWTALKSARKNGHVEIVRLLKAAGAEE